MTRLIVIRPQPGCDATVGAARAMGLDAVGCALFTVEPVAWRAPDERFDALLIGSANVFRHGGAGLARLHELPVIAVGAATAQAAHVAGFSVALTGEGRLQDVIARVDSPSRLLRLCGQERVPVDLPAGVTMDEVVVYATVPQPAPTDLAATLAQGAVVMLHSAAAARHFAALNVPKSRIALACISARTAEAAGAGWRAVGTAPRPDDAALLALAASMCQ